MRGVASQALVSRERQQYTSNHRAFAPVLSGSPAALLAAATASQPLRPQAPSGRCWPAACLLHPALASRWRGWGRVPGGAGEHGRGAGRRRRGCREKWLYISYTSTWTPWCGASASGACSAIIIARPR